MPVNWEVIVWTCVTLAVIMGIFGLILSFISAKNMRVRRERMKEIHTGLTIGRRIMFAGGLYGKVVGIEGDILEVEIAKGTVIRIDRYAVQAVIHS